MPANKPVQKTVNEYLASIDDEQTVEDSRKLIELMQRISGCDPVLWNVGTIGFDSYHYKYESGREGDCHVLGFYPRKDKITIYLMTGVNRFTEHLARLGKFKNSKSCLYIKHLSDVDVAVLEEILTESYAYVKALDVKMHRIDDENNR